MHTGVRQIKYNTLASASREKKFREKKFFFRGMNVTNIPLYYIWTVHRKKAAARYLSNKQNINHKLKRIRSEVIHIFFVGQNGEFIFPLFFSSLLFVSCLVFVYLLFGVSLPLDPSLFAHTFKCLCTSHLCICVSCRVCVALWSYVHYYEGLLPFFEVVSCSVACIYTSSHSYSLNSSLFSLHTSSIVTAVVNVRVIYI